MNLSMNSAMNNAMYAAGNTTGKPAGVAANATPAAATATPDTAASDTRTPDGASAPGQTPVAAPVQALPFGYWIATGGAQPADALPDAAADVPVDPAAAAPQNAAAPTSGAEPAESADALDETRVPDVLLAAMAPMVAPAAMPAMMLAMPGARPAVVSDDAAAPADAPVAQAAGVISTGAVPSNAMAGASARTATPAPALASAPDVALPVAQPAALPAAAARPDLGAAQAIAAQPAAAAPADAAAPEGIADVAPVVSGAGINAAPGPSARAADSIVLAGPPTAWRQSLHEALGERLQLQIGRNIEQATIRLDPPMLGRIDIAIRHSGGNLEVHIAASNTEVLRQLNTVSDSLRSDLAGRQYSSVSVNVTEVPRAQASAQAGGHAQGQPGGQPGADSQGRGRQEQPRTPGLALNDAGQSTSPFSMN